MKVYDFDKTIYSGDSTLDFYFFCLKRQPLIFLCLPHQIVGLLKYKLGLQTKLRYKESFYSFLKKVKKKDKMIDEFWNINKGKINDWYLRQKEVTDIIISASPEFLLKPICCQLNVTLIASVVDIGTGQCISENCYGEEKVRRFKELYPNVEIDQFYSDSLSDAPMAKISANSYLVKKNKITNWHQITKNT